MNDISTQKKSFLKWFTLLKNALIYKNIKNIICKFLFEIKLVLVFKPLNVTIVSKNWNWDLRLEEIRIEINLILRHGIIRQLHICESELLPTVTIFSEHLIKEKLQNLHKANWKIRQLKINLAVKIGCLQKKNIKQSTYSTPFDLIKKHAWVINFMVAFT